MIGKMGDLAFIFIGPFARPSVPIAILIATFQKILTKKNGLAHIPLS